jgi:hypothetical protein
MSASDVLYHEEEQGAFGSETEQPGLRNINPSCVDQSTCQTDIPSSLLFPFHRSSDNRMKWLLMN